MEPPLRLWVEEVSWERSRVLFEMSLRHPNDHADGGLIWYSGRGPDWRYKLEDL